MQIVSTEQLGAYTYEELHVGGLVEGQFPPRTSVHWLTKTKSLLSRNELYERLSHGASKVYLYYPEVDREGKLNLPATILPKVEEEETTSPEFTHYPTLWAWLLRMTSS